MNQKEAHQKVRKYVAKHGKPSIMKVFQTPWGGTSMYLGPPEEVYDAFHPRNCWDLNKEIDWIQTWEFLKNWKKNTRQQERAMKRKFPSFRKLLKSRDKLKRAIKKEFGGK